MLIADDDEPLPPPVPEKRATRWKAEVVDEDDNVLWEVLAHDMPAEMFRSVLFDLDVRIRRVSTPRPGTKVYDYSVHDPVNSIKAAREHAARRETQLGNVLMLLLDRDGGWVSRDEIRRAGGEEGPRRVRELRKLNWPVETKQLARGAAWHVRLNLPGSHVPDEDEDTDGDEET